MGLRSFSGGEKGDDISYADKRAGDKSQEANSEKKNISADPQGPDVLPIGHSIDDWRSHQGQS